MRESNKYIKFLSDIVDVFYVFFPQYKQAPFGYPNQRIYPFKYDKDRR